MSSARVAALALDGQLEARVDGEVQFDAGSPTRTPTTIQLPSRGEATRRSRSPSYCSTTHAWLDGALLHR